MTGTRTRTSYIPSLRDTVDSLLNHCVKAESVMVWQEDATPASTYVTALRRLSKALYRRHSYAFPSGTKHSAAHSSPPTCDVRVYPAGQPSSCTNSRLISTPTVTNMRGVLHQKECGTATAEHDIRTSRLERMVWVMRAFGQRQQRHKTRGDKQRRCGEKPLSPRSYIS